VRKEHADFFDEYRPEARTVLEELLGRYAEYGVTEIDDLGGLRIPPLDQLGSPVEIAASFGGLEQLKLAIAALQEYLYAA